MLWALILSLSMADQSVTGVVKDTSGGVVQGAVVIAQTSSGTAQTITGADGRFTIEKAPDGAMTLIVVGLTALLSPKLRKLRELA